MRNTIKQIVFEEFSRLTDLIEKDFAKFPAAVLYPCWILWLAEVPSTRGWGWPLLPFAAAMEKATILSLFLR